MDHLIQLIQLKQGKLTHEAFLEKFLELTRSVSADFKDSTAPGCMKLSNLYSIVYIAGVDPAFFATKIDSTYSKHPTGMIDDHMALVAEFQSYNQQKTKRVDSEQDSTEPSRALWSGSAPGGLTINCKKCKKKTTLDSSDDAPFCRQCELSFQLRKHGNKDKLQDTSPKPLLASALSLATSATFDASPDAPAFDDENYDDNGTFINRYAHYVDGS
jgi:hypothetical protein